MISSGDEQKHLNFGNNSLEIFNCIEPSFLRKSITIQGSLTDATEPFFGIAEISRKFNESLLKA
jgi:hypothetical protein